MNKINRLLRTARNLLKQLTVCEQGAMQVTEYLLMGTVIALGVLVGLVSYRNSLVLEYGDIAAAVNSLDQSFTYDLIDFAGTTTTTSSVFYDDTSESGSGADTNQSNSVSVTIAGSGEN